MNATKNFEIIDKLNMTPGLVLVGNADNTILVGDKILGTDGVKYEVKSFINPSGPPKKYISIVVTKDT